MSEVTIDTVVKRAEGLRPHYAYLINQFYPVRQPGSKAIVADRLLRLYYDPELLEEWELDWCAARVLVQVEHYYRRHALRQNGRNQLCWDYGTEIAITSSLYDEGIKFHPDTLYPETFKLADGLSAEEYALALYNLCTARIRELEAAVEAAQADDRIEEQLEELSGTEGATFGSAGSEQMKDWEEPPDSSIPAVDALAALMQLREMQPEETTPGTAAGNEVREVTEDRSSAVDWRIQLRQVYGSVMSIRPGMEDYSFAVPDPEIGLHDGVIMPGMVESRPNRALVIDSSGSMGPGRLAQAIAETAAILRQSDGGLWVFSCDAAVHTAREVFHTQQVSLVGGGGTDMGVGIHAAASHHPRPDVIIVITDGDTSWPAKGPEGIRVIIVLVGNGKTPKWAHKVITVPMN